MLSTSKKKIFLYICIILAISFFTYFCNYWNPPHLFWDENYHIASAYKYLNGVFFMEPHPPLGKMFIALGEYIFHPNTHLNTSNFLKTDYITSVPPGFSFVGVRFFPAFFGMMSSVIFFLILLTVSENFLLSFLFTSLYLFENAFILQSRGVLLESIQIFFILLSLLYFCYLLIKKKVSLKQYAILGLILGCNVAVKLNGLVFSLLFFFLYLHEQNDRFFDLLKKGFFFAAGMLTVFLGIYYIHISTGAKVIDNRYYQASNIYKKILAKNQTSNPIYFPLLFYEHLAFVPHYEKGVPIFDSNKPGENGSPPIAWLIGNKAINYRWEKNGDKVRYLYLQGNPVIWFLGLMGVLLSIICVICKVFLPIFSKEKKKYFIIITLLWLYLLYMLQTMLIKRVMYLYHYFIPLIISLILFFILINNLFIGLKKKSSIKIFYSLIFIIIIFIICSFLFFSPLIYYQPLTTQEFKMRNELQWWGRKP